MHRSSRRANVSRRVSAVVAISLMALLVVLDLADAGFRNWWNIHSVTGNIVSSLLVLAVTGLVVDEVVARRQRRDRAVSVAAQSVIVYGQVWRTNTAISALMDSGNLDESTSASQEAHNELRNLANMLLTASSNLFDDPDARLFLEAVQKLVATMFAEINPRLKRPTGANDLPTMMDDLRSTVAPLIERLPADTRPVLNEELTSEELD